MDDGIDLIKLKAAVRIHEGTGPIENGAFLPYKDSLGNPTIGYGHLIANGISPKVAEHILDDDVSAALHEVSAYPWWPATCASSEPRARAIAELYFELGHFRFNGFHHALAAVAAGDWDKAADEFENSLWARQVGVRANVMCNMIRRGQDNVA